MQASHDSMPVPFPPPRICILGAGKFGRLAAERLGRRYPQASILVVDERREKLEGISRDFGLPVLTEALHQFLDTPRIDRETWIVPALPIHFALEWLVHELNKIGRSDHLPVPAAVLDQIPNAYQAASGSLCASYATFICPDNCNEPDQICTVTKSPRPGNLFELLARIEVAGFEVHVVRSWQLAPGVGGYPAESLNRVRDRIIATPRARCLLATSCRCHGVIDALSWDGTGTG